MRTLIIVIGCCVGLTSAQDFYAVNSSSTTGPWESTPSYLSTSEWLTANLTGANANTGNVSVVFNAEVTQNGNYSVTLYTPGCNQVNECHQRGIVNVTGHYVTSVAPDSQTSTQVYQTNEFDKYDEIYQGPVDVNNHGFRPTVTLAAIPGFRGVVVAQKVKFAMVNSTVNATSSSETSTTRSGTATVGTDGATKTASVTVTATALANFGGLDNGAKIGLGVGVSLGVLLCAIIALTIFVRRRRARTAQEEKELPQKLSGEADGLELIKAQLQGESSYKELPGGSSHQELPGGPSHTELPGGPSHAELPGRSILPHELSVLDSDIRL